MPSPNNRNAASFAATICLLALFAILSRSAALTKSATWDETLNAAAGWSYVHARDWRADPEHPPLTKLWSALLAEPLDLAVSMKTMAWRAILASQRWQWDWAVAAVFRSPAVNGDAFIQRARLPMLAFGVALGALIAIWAWRVGGAAAAIPALVLYTFSPDFLGHSSLVTNDVALAFAFLAVAFAAWRLGERINLARISMLGAAVACAILVEFPGLLAIPLTAGLLAFRASENRPWPAGRTELARPVARAAAAVVILVEILVLCWILIWCAYGLRFSATADETPLDFGRLTAQVVEERLRAEAPDRPAPTAKEIAAFRHDAASCFALFSQRNGLLPESWNWGLLALEMPAARKPAFLLGTQSGEGWWYYFPLALLFKEPIAAIVAVVLSSLLLGIWLRRGEVVASHHSWLLACLVAPPSTWAVVAMFSKADIGVRLFFPVLPFVFIATGLVAARAMRLGGRPARRAAVAIGAVLVIECLLAWPNYIAFFNAAAGGPRGGLRLLGESSLDWGQDLKLLAKWQVANPDEKLYLYYNGSADPSAYGIRYVNSFGGYGFGSRRGPMNEPGVFAISATNLQQLHSEPEIQSLLGELRRREPLDVLGGTIYLYRFTPPR